MHKFPKKLSHLTVLAAFSFASLLSGCGTGAGEISEGGDGTDGNVIVEENNPPTATSGEIVLAAGETSKAIDLSAYVKDPDGDAVKITAVSTSNGQVKVLGGTNISYSSTAASKGGYILYVASDGEYQVSGKITLKGAPVVPVTPNIPPLAVDDVATVKAGSSIVLDVLANDIDPDGGQLSIKSVTSTTGVAVVSTDGKITYTPKIDFSDVADIEYTLSDGVATVVGRVAVTVLPYTMNAMFSWMPPEERVDGEPLDPTTDISSYNVMYKEVGWSEYKSVEVLGSKSQVLLQDLGIGDYTIRIAALDHVGLVSEYSEMTASLRP